MTTRPVSSTDPRSDLLEFETRDRRYWAAVIDLWGVPMCALLAAVTITSPSAMFAGMIHVIAVCAPVVTEAVTGSTLGKWLRGVRVVRADGGPPGWRLALKRRAWSGVVVANLAPWVAHGVGGLLLLLAGVSILISMRHGRGDRGWHDRLAGTRVVPAGSWVRRFTEADASAPAT